MRVTRQDLFGIADRCGVYPKCSTAIRHPTPSESGVAPCYSERSACTGSTRVARMAGTSQAANAVSATAHATATYVVESVDVTPNNIPFRT